MTTARHYVPIAKYVAVSCVSVMISTRSKGKGQLVDSLPAKRECWVEGQKIDRQHARISGLKVKGGKHVRLVRQIDGKVEGLRLWLNVKAVHTAKKSQKIAFFAITKRVGSLEKADKFREKALARNPFKLPRYDFFENRQTDFVIYDNLKSPAALMNVDLQGSNNCTIAPCAAAADTKKVWVKTTKSVRAGGHLYCSYQAGSSHFMAIVDGAVYDQYSAVRGDWSGWNTRIKRGKHKGKKVWKQSEGEPPAKSNTKRKMPPSLEQGRKHKAEVKSKRQSNISKVNCAK